MRNSINKSSKTHAQISRGCHVMLHRSRLMAHRCCKALLGCQWQFYEGDVVTRLHTVSGIWRRARTRSCSFLLLFGRQSRMRNFEQKDILVNVVANHLVVHLRCNSGQDKKCKYLFILLNFCNYLY